MSSDFGGKQSAFDEGDSFTNPNKVDYSNNDCLDHVSMTTLNMEHAMTQVNQVMTCIDRQVERAHYAQTLEHRPGALSVRAFNFLNSSGFILIQLRPVIDDNVKILEDFVEPNGLTLIGSDRIGPPVDHATATDISTDDNELGAARDFTAMNDGEATCLLYTSPSPRDLSTSRMPSSA